MNGEEKRLVEDHNKVRVRHSLVTVVDVVVVVVVVVVVGDLNLHSLIDLPLSSFFSCSASTRNRDS